MSAVTEAWYETAFGAFYPLIYGHRDAEEASRCLEQLDRMATLAPPLLDLGCGEGRHLELLARRGLAVGLDLSAPLLQRARTDGGGDLNLVRGDMRRLPVGDGCLGTVVSLFTAFGYFDSKGANARPVAEVARVLRTGGHWCLDYFNADRVRGELAGRPPAVRNRTAGPLVVKEERTYDDARAVVRKVVLLEALPGREEEAAVWGCGPAGLRYVEEVMVFTLDDLDGMARAAGLERVAAAGSYEGAPLGSGDRWLLVYRRGVRT